MALVITMATVSAIGLAPMATTSAMFDATALKPRSKPDENSRVKSWFSTRVSVVTTNRGSLRLMTAASSPGPINVVSTFLKTARA